MSIDDYEGAVDIAQLQVEGPGWCKTFRTRRFEEARVREYYPPGDDKVVSWKMLNPTTSAG